MYEIAVLILTATLGGIGIMLLHWAPWTFWFPVKKLDPPWTYVIGVGVIVGLITGWMLFTQPAYPMSLIGVLSIVGATGGGDLLSYLLDQAGAGRRHRINGENNRPD